MPGASLKVCVAVAGSRVKRGTVVSGATSQKIKQPPALPRRDTPGGLNCKHHINPKSCRLIGQVDAQTRGRNAGLPLVSIEECGFPTFRRGIVRSPYSCTSTDPLFAIANSITIPSVNPHAPVLLPEGQALPLCASQDAQSNPMDTAPGARFW